MKWIVLTIVLVVVPYTSLTLRYRKPGPAFRPYQDMEDRANVMRLLAAGYQRITLSARRPADPLPPAAAAVVTPAAGGLPAGLRSTLVQQPLLPAEIVARLGGARVEREVRLRHSIHLHPARPPAAARPGRNSTCAARRS
jgi:hypothetical protein